MTDLKSRLQGVVPDVPEAFDAAMRRTLAGIVAQECAKAPAEKTTWTRRRILIAALIITLLLATVAIAATILRHNVFEVTMGTTPENAHSLIKYDLARETVGDCEITIKEAAYDGMSLYVVYSIRDKLAAEPLGTYDPENGYYWLGESDMSIFERDNVGCWYDTIWIDGLDVGMPDMSGGDTVGSETPGEILSYMQYRLDQENMYLNGKNVEIAMPIGRRQPYDILTEDPVTGNLKKPDNGLVTFHLDCSIREGVITQNPNIVSDLGYMTAWAQEVVYSPIQMYLTIGMSVKQEAMDAYIAEHGEGDYDESGNLLWKYDGMELTQDWAFGARLVDGEGNRVFKSMDGFYGCHSVGADVAYYTFPYMESYPDEMYLAPMPPDGSAADMTRAVRVK